MFYFIFCVANRP